MIPLAEKSSAAAAEEEPQEEELNETRLFCNLTNEELILTKGIVGNKKEEELALLQ